MTHCDLFKLEDQSENGTIVDDEHFKRDIRTLLHGSTISIVYTFDVELKFSVERRVGLEGVLTRDNGVPFPL